MATVSAHNMLLRLLIFCLETIHKFHFSIAHMQQANTMPIFDTEAPQSVGQEASQTLGPKGCALCAVH